MSSVEGRGALRINGRLTIPAKELVVQFARSAGPGGQRVNKVETKVVLRFSIARSAVLGDWRRERLMERLASRLTRSGELVVHASRFRDQRRNLDDARERLATLLREALRTPRARVETRPTRASRERRLRAKRRRSDVKKMRREELE